MPLCGSRGCGVIWRSFTSQRICIWIAPQKVMLSRLGCWRLVMALALSSTKTMDLPEAMCLPENTVDALINAIYPNINQGTMPDSFSSNAQSSPPKRYRRSANQAILDQFPGEETVVHSGDKAHGDNDGIYPIEYLNSLNVFLDFPWPTSLSSQDVHLCSCATSIQPMASVMEHGWFCWM